MNIKLVYLEAYFLFFSANSFFTDLFFILKTTQIYKSYPMIVLNVQSFKMCIFMAPQI